MAALLTSSQELRRQCIRLQIRSTHGSRYVRRDPLLPDKSATMRECARGIRQLQGAKERLLAVRQASTVAADPKQRDSEGAAAAALKPQARNHPRDPDQTRCGGDKAAARRHAVHDNVDAWVTATLLSHEQRPPSANEIVDGGPHDVDGAAGPKAGVRRRLMGLGTTPRPGVSQPLSGRDACSSTSGKARNTEAVERPSSGGVSCSPVFSVFDSPSESPAGANPHVASIATPKRAGERKHEAHVYVDRVGSGVCRMALPLRQRRASG